MGGYINLGGGSQRLHVWKGTSDPCGNICQLRLCEGVSERERVDRGWCWGGLCFIEGDEFVDSAGTTRFNYALCSVIENPCLTPDVVGTSKGGEGSARGLEYF